MAKAIPLNVKKKSSTSSSPGSGDKLILIIGLLFSIATVGGVYNFYTGLNSFKKETPPLPLESPKIEQDIPSEAPASAPPLIKEEALNLSLPAKELQLPEISNAQIWTNTLLKASLESLSKKPVPNPVEKKKESRKSTPRQPEEGLTNKALSSEIKESVLEDKAFKEKATLTPKKPVSTDQNLKESSVSNAPVKKVITTEPVIKEEFKPRILAVNQSQVWVRVDEKTTLMYNIGDKVPGFGVFKGTLEDKASFDSGTYKID